MVHALHAGCETVQDIWRNEATGVALGRESLGIFSPDPQPVFNSDRTLALAMEGELFAPVELRQDLAQKGYPAAEASDAELALYLFESEGPTGLAGLHGVFALAIWDIHRRQLILANDRFGLRPLYYTHRPDLFAFAGEIKGLLALNGVSRVVNDDAVADFFAFGYVLGQKTFFREIHLLPPATVLTVQDGTICQHTYWSLEYASVTRDRSDDACVEEMTHLLSQAVARRLAKGLTVGLPLSGGLDSLTLLAVATQVLGVSLPSYTFGLPGSQDMHHAQQAAQIVRVPHRALYLEENYLSAYAERTVERADGLLNCLNSHGLALQAMAKQCQVMMLGNGGDSFFYAYRSYRRKLLEIAGDMIQAYYQVTNRIFSAEETAHIFNDHYYTRIKGQAFASLESTLADLTPNSVDNIYDAHHLREHQRRYTLQGLFTVNHSLEYSEPYYDYDLVDFALGLPVHLRWDRNVHKMVLTRLSPPLARLTIKPLEKLPWFRRGWDKSWRRVKRLSMQLGIAWSAKAKPRPYHFTRLPYLLRTANRGWVEEVLLSRRTLERGYFRPQAIQQLVEDHMNQRRNLSLQLGALITFELWHRIFLD